MTGGGYEDNSTKACIFVAASLVITAQGPNPIMQVVAYVMVTLLIVVFMYLTIKSKKDEGW